jgi:hypothetical protein
LEKDEEYGEGVAEQLDEIEFDPARRPLWEAVVDGINDIFDHPESARSREHLIKTTAGKVVFRVPLRVPSELHNYSVLWGYNEKSKPMILNVGPWPPLS